MQMKNLPIKCSDDLFDSSGDSQEDLVSQQSKRPKRSASHSVSIQNIPCQEYELQAMFMYTMGNSYLPNVLFDFIFFFFFVIQRQLQNQSFQVPGVEKRKSSPFSFSPVSAWQGVVWVKSLISLVQSVFFFLLQEGIPLGQFLCKACARDA